MTVKKVTRFSPLVNAVGILLFWSVNSVVSSAEMMDRVLVIVNEDVITQAEFDYRLATIKAEMQRRGEQALPPDLERQLLEGMVGDRLQVQEAERRGINISDAELDAALVRFAAAQNIDVSGLQQQITAQGQSFSRFKQSVRESLVISRLTEFYARTRVVVPDYEIDGFIAVNDMGDGGTEYQIARILIEDQEANSALAQRIVEELREGGSFQQAVLNYSSATDAQDGGVLPWSKLNDMNDLYADAIRPLGVGEVTDVLVGANGLHILKLLEVRGDREEVVQTDVRHILIRAETAVAKSQAAKKLRKVRQRILAGEEFADLARIFSDDSVSAASGGGLGWVSPGETVPPFEQTYQQLALNEISEPFETRFGVHILEVLDRRQQNITDQLIRTRVDSILRRQRAEREFEQWVRQLKEQAYIQYITEPV